MNDKPFRLPAEYVILIAWAFDYDTLAGLAEQVAYDERLSATERLGLEGYLDARERILQRGPLN